MESAPGFAAILKADNLQLSLLGDVKLSSSGENAVISQNVALKKADSNTTGKLILNGNYLVCGTVGNQGMLTFSKGQLKTIDKGTYESMLTSSILNFNANGGKVSTTEKLIYYGQAYGDLPVPTRTGYEFTGWYTAASGGTKVTANTIVTVLANQTLYAHWSAMAYTVSWNTGTGYTIQVQRTASPYAAAPTGALTSDTTVYYGDVLSITYTASTGYTISSKGSTSVTVSGNVTTSQIYATASVNAYTVSWNTGTGYTIVVKRTSSPKAGATTGTLTSGAKIYYGDVLSISYTKQDYYTIKSNGATSITVTGNVTSSQICATAELNPIKGWVKASELPSGAQVTSRKWTYNLTTTTESKETSLAGYTQTGSRWVESGRGSQNYASFPSGFDTSHSIYQSFAKSALSGYENDTTKRVVTNQWGGFVYWHWMYDTSYRESTDRRISSKYGYFTATGGTSGSSAYLYKHFFAMISSVDCPYLDNNYCCNQNLPSYNCKSILPADKTHIGTPRCFRFDYYVSSYVDYYKLFTYSKTEAKESTSQVTASSTISNVQEWVQYRAK